MNFDPAGALKVTEDDENALKNKTDEKFMPNLN